MRFQYFYKLLLILLLTACGTSQGPKKPDDVYIEGNKMMNMGRNILCGITSVNGNDVKVSGLPNFQIYIPYDILRLEGECVKVYENPDQPRESFNLTFNEFNTKPGEKFTIYAKLQGDAGINLNVPLTGFIMASDGGIAAVAPGQKIN